jgi:hypothetical protein
MKSKKLRGLGHPGAERFDIGSDVERLDVDERSMAIRSGARIMREMGQKKGQVRPGRTPRRSDTTPSAECVRFVTERRMTSGHDADPVINPLADRAEVLRLGCVVPTHLLDARLGRRQLLPQRGNFTPSGLAKIFGE